MLPDFSRELLSVFILFLSFEWSDCQSFYKHIFSLSLLLIITFLTVSFLSFFSRCAYQKTRLCLSFASDTKSLTFPFLFRTKRVRVKNLISLTHALNLYIASTRHSNPKELRTESLYFNVFHFLLRIQTKDINHLIPDFFFLAEITSYIQIFIILEFYETW